MVRTPEREMVGSGQRQRLPMQEQIAKRLTNKDNGSSFCQPSKDNKGNPITSVEQQLESWADFLQIKFAARTDEPAVDLNI